jgi:ribulose-5-phosphate 4-epimerase/fuculose-1-phosphate aldolase
MSGHISVRDPEHAHTFWTNPLGKHFATLKASDMVLVDYDGNIVGGNTTRPANAAGFLIHSAVHKARPDVTAACHCHGKAGKAWSAFARKLDMINQDVTYFYGDAQAVYPEFGGVVFSEEEGKRLAASLGPHGKGLILRNHGLLVNTPSAFPLVESSDISVDCWEHSGRGCLPLYSHGALLRDSAHGRGCSCQWYSEGLR